MAKIYHEHVARVMQGALTIFRRYNGGETVTLNSNLKLILML